MQFTVCLEWFILTYYDVGVTLQDYHALRLLMYLDSYCVVDFNSGVFTTVACIWIYGLLYCWDDYRVYEFTLLCFYSGSVITFVLGSLGGQYMGVGKVLVSRFFLIGITLILFSCHSGSLLFSHWFTGSHIYSGRLSIQVKISKYPSKLVKNTLKFLLHSLATPLHFNSSFPTYHSLDQPNPIHFLLKPIQKQVKNRVKIIKNRSKSVKIQTQFPLSRAR